eukprot:c21639_g3_i1 orf=57-254(-)
MVPSLATTTASVRLFPWEILTQISNQGHKLLPPPAELDVNLGAAQCLRESPKIQNHFVSARPSWT